MKIDLSIIVPVYNIEEYLVCCIESLVKQNIERLEIILIDDGSTDNSPQITDSYARKYDFIEVIHQENRGLPGARNRGLEIASGEYIAFVDSDDWLTENTLGLLYKQAVGQQADIVMGHTTFCYPDGSRYTPFRPIPDKIKNILISGKDAFIELMKNSAYPPMVYSYIYRREWLQAHRLQFAPVIHEDELWTPIAMGVAERMVITNIEFYNYRQRDNSIVHTINKKRRIRSLIFIANRLLEFASRFSFSGEDKQFKSYLYVKIFELYACAFRLLPLIKDSSFILPPHHLYCIFKVYSKLTQQQAVICANYYKQATGGLKEFLKGRFSPWNRRINEKERIDKRLILIYNRKGEYPLTYRPEEIPSGYIFTTDRRYFVEADVVVFYLPDLLYEMDEDLDKPEHQTWVGWYEECDENHPILQDNECMDLFELKINCSSDSLLQCLDKLLKVHP